MQLNLKNHRANIFEKNPFDINKTSIIFVPGAGMDHRIISMFNLEDLYDQFNICLLYTSPSPRDSGQSRMPASA